MNIDFHTELMAAKRKLDTIYWDCSCIEHRPAHFSTEYDNFLILYDGYFLLASTYQRKKHAHLLYSMCVKLKLQIQQKDAEIKNLLTGIP